MIYQFLQCSVTFLALLNIVLKRKHAVFAQYTLDAIFIEHYNVASTIKIKYMGIFSKTKNLILIKSNITR